MIPKPPRSRLPLGFAIMASALLAAGAGRAAARGSSTPSTAAPGTPGPSATAASPHCRDLRDAMDRDEKSHGWAQLLTDAQSFDHDCAGSNPILKSGALFSIGLAQLRTGHFDDALATAKQCLGITGSQAFAIDCRMIEAWAFDGLGRTAEEKAVLIAILDALPSKGSSKIRKSISAELAAIDPEAAKEHGHRGRSRRHDDDAAPDSRYYGTGFVVTADGQIVTNWHVVAECGTYWTADGQKLSLLRSDKDRDLALLKSGQAAAQVAGLRGEGPKVGEAIVVYGYPLPGLLASSGAVTTGIVSAPAGLGDEANRFQISAPVQPGNSGGPVLDAEGRVIGVVQGKLSDTFAMKYTGQVPQNVNFAIPEGELLGFLKEAGITPTPAPDRSKEEVSDIAAAAHGFVTQIVCSPQGVVAADTPQH